MTMQRFDPKKIGLVPPHSVDRAIHTEMCDLNQLLWAGMAALAEDVYSRCPGGSRKFEELATLVGLQLGGVGGKKVSVAEKLNAIQPEGAVMD